MASRKLYVCLVTLIAGVLGSAGSAGASGGGACGGPLTNENTTDVTIEFFCNEPSGVHIDVGDTVTWTNRDPVPHTVTGQNRIWGSYRTLKRGQSIAFRFNEPGLYPYYCAVHPGMVGAVMVYAGGVPDAIGGTARPDAVTRLKLGQRSTRGAVQSTAFVPEASEPNVWAVVLVVLGLPVLAFGAVRVTVGSRPWRARSKKTLR